MNPRTRLKTMANELHLAVLAGSIERTLAVLATGSVDIDQGDAAGATPLMMAAVKGNAHIVEILLRKGANVSMVDNGGVTALHFSAEQGLVVAVAKLLARAGADLEAKITTTRHTPLHLAALYGRSEMVGALIEAGANPDSRVPSGATALHMAVVKGHLDMLRELIRGKANPSLINTDPPEYLPTVPLDLAAEYGHSDMVRELVQEFGVKGCDVANDGQLALRAAARKQHLDVMTILTEAGVVDTAGLAFCSAAANGREESVKFLLRQRCKESNSSSVDDVYINARPNGCTPLAASIRSCSSQAPRIVRLLIDAGADTTSAVRVTNSQGELEFNGTPLAFTATCLRKKFCTEGKPATEEHLHRLEATRRLFLRVEAVHAVSWLWPSDAPVISHGARSSPKPPLSALRLMLPILKRRAKRRSVLVAAFLRYSAKA
ncbi:unnamed protein product [Ectocarpus sp. 12 AP-2014]